MNQIAIGQKHLPAVREDEPGVQIAAVCADKFNACRGQRIQRPDEAVRAVDEDKSVVCREIGGRRLVQQVICRHISVGTFAQQPFKAGFIGMSL